MKVYQGKDDVKLSCDHTLIAMSGTYIKGDMAWCNWCGYRVKVLSTHRHEEK